MELNLDELRGTIVGEFLKCAMMSDVANITDYKQSGLSLEVTLNGNELDLQKLFSMFEERLRSLDVFAAKKDELVRKVESSLKATKIFVKDVNDERRGFDDDIRDAVSRIASILERQCGDMRAISVTESLDSLLSALK